MYEARQCKKQYSRVIHQCRRNSIQCLFINNRTRRLLNRYNVPNQCIAHIENVNPPNIGGNTMYFWTHNGNDISHITAGIGNAHRTVFFTYMNNAGLPKAVVVGIGSHLNNITYTLNYFSSNERNQVVLGGNRVAW